MRRSVAFAALITLLALAPWAKAQNQFTNDKLEYVVDYLPWYGSRRRPRSLSTNTRDHQRRSTGEKFALPRIGSRESIRMRL